MFKRIFFLFVLLHFSVLAFAQDQKAIDSLIRVAQKNPQDTSSISAYINLSQALSNSDYDKSLDYAKSGLKIATMLNDTFRKGRCYFQMGYAHFSFGYAKEAIDDYTNGMPCFEKVNSKYWIAKSLNGIGNAQRKLGRLKEATDSFLAAKKLFEEVKDKKGIAGTYNNLGIILMAEGQQEKALDYFKLARQMNIELNNQSWLGKNLSNMGNAFFNLKQFDSAEVYFKESIKIDLILNDLGGWSLDIMNLGNVYTSKKDYKKAMEQFNMALDFDRKNGRENDMALVMNNIAGLYTETGEFENAKKFLDSTVTICLKYGDLENLNYAYKGYTVMYKKSGDFKNAFKYYELYAVQKDSITSTDMKNQMDQMEESFREEKLKEQNESLEQGKLLQDAQLESSHIINYAAIGGGVLVLLLTVTIFKRYQLKKKANIDLEERNREIESQKKIIEEINKDISDSINYAKKIQDTLLPGLDEINTVFEDAFVFFRPKNVVSGDFFWFTNKGDKKIVVVADCTGHGVPGAFMSMIGIDKMNQAVLEFNLSCPSEILAMVNRWLKTILKQDDLTGGMRDGMDAALISIDKQKMMLEYSGANRPLWIIRNQELIEIKPTKVSLGGHTPTSQEFEAHQFPLQKNDCIYLFSDGYADQFGGEKEKKMTLKNFKSILLSLSTESMESQKRIVAEKFDGWRNKLEQVDDICVIGIRV